MVQRWEEFINGKQQTRFCGSWKLIDRTQKEEITNPQNKDLEYAKTVKMLQLKQRGLPHAVTENSLTLIEKRPMYVFIFRFVS